MSTDTRDRLETPRVSPTLKMIIIAFAIVEALGIGYMLLSMRR